MISVIFFLSSSEECRVNDSSFLTRKSIKDHSFFWAQKQDRRTYRNNENINDIRSEFLHGQNRSNQKDVADQTEEDEHKCQDSTDKGHLSGGLSYRLIVPCAWIRAREVDFRWHLTWWQQSCLVQGVGVGVGCWQYTTRGQSVQIQWRLFWCLAEKNTNRTHKAI